MLAGQKWHPGDPTLQLGASAVHKLHACGCILSRDQFCLVLFLSCITTPHCSGIIIGVSCEIILVVMYCRNPGCWGLLMWMNNAKQFFSDIEIIVARIYIVGVMPLQPLQQATFLIVTDRHLIRMRNTYCVDILLSNTNTVTKVSSFSRHLKLFFERWPPSRLQKQWWCWEFCSTSAAEESLLREGAETKERYLVFGMNDVLQIYLKVWMGLMGRQGVKVHKLISRCRICKNPISSTHFARSPQCPWGVAYLL